jgi:hypothetical protein
MSFLFTTPNTFGKQIPGGKKTARERMRDRQSLAPRGGGRKQKIQPSLSLPKVNPLGSLMVMDEEEEIEGFFQKSNPNYLIGNCEWGEQVKEKSDFSFLKGGSYGRILISNIYPDIVIKSFLRRKGIDCETEMKREFYCHKTIYMQLESVKRSIKDPQSLIRTLKVPKIYQSCFFRKNPIAQCAFTMERLYPLRGTKRLLRVNTQDVSNPNFRSKETIDTRNSKMGWMFSICVFWADLIPFDTEFYLTRDSRIGSGFRLTMLDMGLCYKFNMENQLRMMFEIFFTYDYYAGTVLKWDNENISTESDTRNFLFFLFGVTKMGLDICNWWYGGLGHSKGKFLTFQVYVKSLQLLKYRRLGWFPPKRHRPFYDKKLFGFLSEWPDRTFRTLNGDSVLCILSNKTFLRAENAFLLKPPPGINVLAEDLVCTTEEMIKFHQKDKKRIEKIAGLTYNEVVQAMDVFENHISTQL